MNKLLSKSLLALLIATGSSHAETPSYHLLTYPFSVRAAAMGGTMAAHDADAIDVNANPAAYSFTQTIQAQAGFVNHLAGIQGFTTAGVLPLEAHRLFGEVVYFDYGLFNGADEFGKNTGTFGYHEIAFQAGYAYSFSEQIRLGARLGLYQRVADGMTHSRSFTDVGAMYHSAEDSLTLGVMVSNLSVDDSGESTPATLRLGSSKVLTYLPLKLNLDAEYRDEEDWLIAIGGEVLVHPQFRLRLGINTRRFDLQTAVTREDFLAGGSLGFIISWQGIVFESAIQSFGAAGTVSQLSLAYQL